MVLSRNKLIPQLLYTYKQKYLHYLYRSIIYLGINSCSLSWINKFNRISAGTVFSSSEFRVFFLNSSNHEFFDPFQHR